MTFKKAFFLLTAVLGFALTQTTHAQSHGKASYYGKRAHGARMSDGTRYHKDSLTCAHKTLPFGTLLKVTNKANGKEVIVRVADRGPFVRGRVVDVSMAAAKQLGMVSSGVAHVMVEPVGHVDDPFINDRPTEMLAETGHGLPEPRYVDPATGESYTMAEWRERGNQERQRQLAEARRKNKPRYRILGTKLTAKAIKAPAARKK